MNSVEFDPENGTAYVRVSTEAVAKTVQLEYGLNVDLDAAGKPVGIEIMWEPN